MQKYNNYEKHKNYDVYLIKPPQNTSFSRQSRNCHHIPKHNLKVHKTQYTIIYLLHTNTFCTFCSLYWGGLVWLSSEHNDHFLFACEFTPYIFTPYSSFYIDISLC